MLRFVYNMVQSDKNNARADEINVKAFNKIASAEKGLEEQKRKTRISIEKLANRKKGILSTSFVQFLDVYEKIIKINFTDGDGIKELSTLSLSKVEIGQVRDMICVATSELSTGQMITTMIVKGGFSGMIRQESEMNVSEARMRSSQARVIESQVETSCVALDGISQRSERISNLLSKLNVLFVKSITNTKKLVDSKGIDRKSYSQEDRDQLGTCINIATTLKKVIDTPLLNENGELEEQSKIAIGIGNDYINKINSSIK